MRNLGLFAVWVGVTLFVTGLTWQIVSAAEGQVSDGPLTQQFADQSAPTPSGSAGTTASTGGGVSTTTPPGSSTTSFFSDSSTSTLSGSTTTDGIVTTDNGGTIPPTTVPGTATTTTTPSGESTTTVPGGGASTTIPPSDEYWALRSIPTIGGTVMVRYRTNEVRLVSATPLPGFRVEVDEPGPPGLRVDLISATVSVEIRAKWGSNGLEVEVREDRD